MAKNNFFSVHSDKRCASHPAVIERSVMVVPTTFSPLTSLLRLSSLLVETEWMLIVSDMSFHISQLLSKIDE